MGPSVANRAALAAVRTRAERERPRHLARVARALAKEGVDADVEALLGVGAQTAPARGSGRATCA